MNNFEYKVSMIVPIYNMEKFLRDCLESLVNQTIDLNEMEVLLIDDGSPDDSIQIMEEYAAKYPCMKIFRKENEGLSQTRNYGIQRAKGKYIMYIDADDTLTPETVKSVTDFFDLHYDEVDLVTYNEVPIINGKKGKPHYRFRTLVQSGVYDLNRSENAFISQTRINICVKNMPGENVLFDFNREFRHEDQKYCIEVVRKKMKIGYCDKGLYLYLHQPDSIVRTYFYAYYIFETTMKFWEEIFSYYKNEKVPQYIQALYINDVNWKTTSNVLLPYHYEESDLEKAKERILTLLNRVDDEIILRHPAIDNFHRQYFISLKRDNSIKLLTGPNEIVITNHDSVIYETKKLEIVLLKFKVVNNKIKFLAFVKSPIFNYLDKPQLFMIKNRNYQELEEVELKLSSWSYYKTKQVTNKFWLFDLEVDLEGLSSFEFQVGINGDLYKAAYYFMPQVIFNHKIKRYRYYKDGKEFKYDTGVFYIKDAEEKAIVANRKSISRKYKKSRAVWLARNICMLDIKRYENVWLYHDCKGVKKDNGYYQFEHDIQKNDGVRRYYVINEENFEEAKRSFPFNQRKYLVKFGSRFHRYLYLKAQKVLTAYIEKNNYFPFDNKLYAKYIEVCNQPDIIYLQHGVLHAHVPWKYSLDRLVIDKEVVSTTFELENLKNNYCFTDQTLIPCGMPRYDFIDTNQKSVNRILFAPSWRKYLIGMVGSEWITTEEKFLKSKFYKETSEFLNSEKLQMLLQENDFYLDFKLHPIFERYKHLYQIDNDRVVMAESKISEVEYKIFITDFSSFVFDFVYLEKPIIYFMPDDEMFRAGMNDYRELDMPLNDAFGDLALSAEEAILAIEKIMKNNCKVEEKYLKKMKNFFLYKDNNQRERLYQALIED